MSSQDVQQTVYERLDPASKFWLGDHDDTPVDNLASRLNEVDDDVSSAVQEARGRRPVDDEIEQSRTSIEVLRKASASSLNAARFFEELDL